MNPQAIDIHLNTHLIAEDYSVIRSTGYLLHHEEPTALTIVEPTVTHNTQMAMLTQDVQPHAHSRETNVRSMLFGEDGLTKHAVILEPLSTAESFSTRAVGVPQLRCGVSSSGPLQLQPLVWCSSGGIRCPCAHSFWPE
jgi:hypothetical protein